MRSRSIHGGRGNESRGCCFCRCPDKSFAYSPQNIHATSCHQSPYRPFMGHRSAKRITAGGLKCSTLWKSAALFSQAPWARSLAASRFNLKPDPRGYSETRASRATGAGCLDLCRGIAGQELFEHRRLPRANWRCGAGSTRCTCLHRHEAWQGHPSTSSIPPSKRQKLPANFPPEVHQAPPQSPPANEPSDRRGQAEKEYEEVEWEIFTCK